MAQRHTRNWQGVHARGRERGDRSAARPAPAGASDASRAQGIAASIPNSTPGCGRRSAWRTTFPGACGWGCLPHRAATPRSCDSPMAAARTIPSLKSMPWRSRSSSRTGRSPRIQDFIVADHSVFFARNVQHILEFLVATMKGTPVPQLAATTHPKVVGFSSVATRSLLDMTYWSQTPYKLGEGAVKYVVTPSASPDGPAIPLDQLTGLPARGADRAVDVPEEQARSSTCR